MSNGIGNEYRRKSTILGDSDILSWSREQNDLYKAKEQKEKAHIADKIPNIIKSKPLNGVEMEQASKGMPLLTIWKRRMNVRRTGIIRYRINR